MMGLHVSLLRWSLRTTLPATAIAVPAAWLYALVASAPLAWNDEWVVVFVLVHSIALAMLQGRFRTGGFAFLYTRGYSRDTLWAHTMLASLVSVLMVWLPVALFIWLPIRSLVQDRIFQSPWFPLVMPREASVPGVCLGFYLVLLPSFHYAWMRMAQPTRGQLAGLFLACGIAVVLLSLIVMRRWTESFAWLVCAAGLIIAAISLIAGFRLHRKMEVGI